MHENILLHWSQQVVLFNDFITGTAPTCTIAHPNIPNMSTNMVTKDLRIQKAVKPPKHAEICRKLNDLE